MVQKDLQQAAVEAAKVGASVEGILGAADKLLDFESSITAQFKAQVLTGKQINTERARQLSLDGDIAGLTQEIQSIRWFSWRYPKSKRYTKTISCRRNRYISSRLIKNISWGSSSTTRNRTEKS